MRTKTNRKSRYRLGVELIPSAPRMMRSLRDTGHIFITAVADIIDNSIEFNATIVDIQVEFNGANSWVRISDNGKGMNSKELKEAMRYGSERDYGEDDLGKFGLGLNLASFNQCQKFSVASRNNPDRSNIAGYCWDMEHINKTGRWMCLPLERKDMDNNICAPLKSSTGTVVLWEKLDRMLDYQHPDGEFARKKFAAMARELERHLAMVFHRFISGETRRRKLKIILNGNEILPWDPFARKEPKTKVLDPLIIPLEHQGSKGEIKIQPYILPHKKEFSSDEAWRYASGPANWNQQQGLYFYRSDRLVQAGGWCLLRVIDEHTKLARIAVLFTPKLDEAFKINVTKTRVQLPHEIKEQVDKAVKPMVKMARDIYDKNERSPSYGSALPVNTGALITSSATGQSQTGPSDAPVSGQSDTQPVWTFDDIQNKLETIATPEEKPVIKAVCNRFRERVKTQEQS